MATKKTKLAVYRNIKDNLNRRIKTIEEERNNLNGFGLSRNAYFKYLNDNMVVAKVVKGLILEGRLYRTEIREIFNTSIMLPGFRNKRVKEAQLSTPLFWDEELEKRFGLRKEFIDMMRPIKKEGSLFKNESISRDLFDGEYVNRSISIIRKLHDDIMEILDEHIVLITLSNKEENDGRNRNNKTGLPFVEIIKTDGYFRLSKHSKGILIGGKDGRRFRLLQALCVPFFGTKVKRDIIWGYINQPKDDYDNELKDSYERPKKIALIIDNTIKELRKKKYGFQGRVKFKNNEYKNFYWLTLTED